jgi:hypothetical protein
MGGIHSMSIIKKKTQQNSIEKMVGIERDF